MNNTVRSVLRLVFIPICAALLLSSLPEPAAAAYPPYCKPVGSRLCSSPRMTPFIYTPKTCSSPERHEDQENAFLEYEEDEWGGFQCPYTLDDIGWIPEQDPQTSNIDFSVSCFGPSIQYPRLYYGIEKSNFWLFDATYDQGPFPACGNTQTDVKGVVTRERDAFCPRGFNSGGMYCWMSTAAYDFAKNRGECPEGQCKIGNPISPGIGNKYQKEIDYRGTGPFPLELVRHYNSSMRMQDNLNDHYSYYLFSNYFGEGSYSRIAPAELPGGMYKNVAPDAIGASWRHSYQRAVSVVSTSYVGYNMTTAFLYRPDGKVFAFNFYNNEWLAPPDVNGQLIELTDAGGVRTGWEYAVGATGETEHYDAFGQLQSIENRAGVTQTMSYDLCGRLTEVADPYGRSLTFSYATACGSLSVSYQLDTVTDPAGGVYQYNYDIGGNLVSVEYPDNSIRQYVYEDPNYPRALTGIIDENGDRYATYAYNSNGQAYISEHAGGHERVTVSYNHTITPSVVTVTDANAVVRTYNQSAYMGVVKTTSISQPCTGCGGQAASFTYDTNGNPTVKVDFNGHQTRYSYDTTRNLETSRTEAYGTSDARTITTQWHATYRLPIQISEPGRVTDLVYDAEGNLTSRTITAGSESRTWTMTYDGDGKLLTLDGPRTAVNDTTTFTYYQCSTGYECGRPQTITNTLGHLTSLNSYDAHGRVLNSTDPNGLVTAYTYDARGRVETITQTPPGGTARVTTYAYDDAGQLTSVSLPNGTALSYSYNAAHYLTEVSDNLGNRISYSYDLMGNRIGENTYDPGSVLTRTVSTTYDELNRIDTLNAAGSITDLDYDAEGNLKEETDPNINATSHSYDPLDRLIQTVDALTGVTQ